MEIDNDIRRLGMEGGDDAALRDTAIAKGMNMKTVFQDDGMAKALLGETTIEEVFRVAP